MSNEERAERLKAKLSNYKHQYPINVEWGDMDAMGHVNNTRYFYYGEASRLAFLQSLHPEFFNSAPEDLEQSAALAEVSCRFKVSLTFPDSIIVYTGISIIDESEFKLSQLIYSNKLKGVAAEMEARMVSFNYKQKKRAVIEGDFREKLSQYLIN